MVEKLDNKSPIARFFILYDKRTNEPMLDPCFSEYEMEFVCGHKKSLFKDTYDMNDQFCSECNAMRSVKEFKFVGVNLNDVDYDRPNEIIINLMEWDCESKSGIYVLARPKKMPDNLLCLDCDKFIGSANNPQVEVRHKEKFPEHNNFIIKKGKWIASIDHWQTPNHGGFSDEEKKSGQEKYAEQGTARYADQQSITVFEVPDYAMNVPDVVANLKRYVDLPDVKVFVMKQGRQRNNGTYEWIKIKEMNQEDLIVPELKTV